MSRTHVLVAELGGIGGAVATSSLIVVRTTVPVMMIVVARKGHDNAAHPTSRAKPTNNHRTLPH